MRSNFKLKRAYLHDSFAYAKWRLSLQHCLINFQATERTQIPASKTFGNVRDDSEGNLVFFRAILNSIPYTDYVKQVSGSITRLGRLFHFINGS